MTWILRERLPDGSFPQVIYGNGRENRYPQWVAGVGDVLRAMAMMQQSGMELTLEPTLGWLLNGQCLPAQLAPGMASPPAVRRKSRQVRRIFATCCPCAGGSTKRFAFWPAPFPICRRWRVPQSNRCRPHVRPGENGPHMESAAEIVVMQDGQALYQWRKGEDWAHLD
ncbi:MAG: hypothetical protein R2911_36180 [Caldilineaceae bacterium]